MSLLKAPDSRSDLPLKTCELRCHLADSTIWNDFRFRDSDVVIVTWAKSGTTWMQQIVSQLIFGGAEGINVAEMSPWVDFRLGAAGRLALLEAQTHRRFLKTHLPVEALGISPKPKYIYLGRDGRDAVWSHHNHFRTLKAERLEAINDDPGRVGPPIERPPESVREYFRTWLERDGYPLWPFWSHVRSWWAIRDLPNVKLLHFNDLKGDLAGSIRSIADFLETPTDAETFPKIVEHCSFNWMKAHASLVAPGGGVGWDDGGASFIHKGTNGRWRDVLTKQDCAEYEARALAELGPECARWLETGERF